MRAAAFKELASAAAGFADMDALLLGFSDPLSKGSSILFGYLGRQTTEEAQLPELLFNLPYSPAKARNFALQGLNESVPPFSTLSPLTIRMLLLAFSLRESSRGGPNSWI
jgi:hypothetical protein